MRVFTDKMKIKFKKKKEDSRGFLEKLKLCNNLKVELRKARQREKRKSIVGNLPEL